MAQRFRRHLHAGRVSMKYSRRSKRGGRRTEEIKCSDTSMVKNKEDFMKILGLQMKKQEEEKKMEEADAMVEKKNKSSPATIKIRDCSVVITGENCKICGLLLKCTSDVIFHTEMRHGNGFTVCGNYIEANILESQEKINADIQRRKRRRSSNSNNSNDNKLRLTFKIGHEVISEISINRRHLKMSNGAEKTLTDRRGGNCEKSPTLKNDYKSSVAGIDSFFSDKNHCNDYVISVQPLNHTHQRTSRDTLLLEGSQYNSNSNYVEATRGIEEINLTSINSLQERLPRWSLQDDLTYNNDNNNNNNNNNNNKSLNIKDSLINECNMSDKENESRKTQSVKNFMDVNASVQAVKTNLPSCQIDSDSEEIQEILHTIERKRVNNQANIKRKFEYPLYEDSTISHSEEFVESSKKMHWPTYSIVV